MVNISNEPISTESQVFPILSMKAYRGSSGKLPRILNLDTGWWCVVNIIPRPIYFRGKKPPVSIDWKAEWVPDPVWTFWRRDKLLTPGRIRTPDCHCLVTTLITLSRLK